MLRIGGCDVDLFKFVPAPGAEETILENGMPINGIQSAMWIERYREPGEFEIKAKLSSGLIQYLPIGTFISHTNTFEVMLIENIEIEETQDSDADVIFSGRSFDAYLENRIVGTNQVRDAVYFDYGIYADYTWNQAVALINAHITAPIPPDQLSGVVAYTAMTGTGVAEVRSIKHMTVLQALNELLAIDDLGVSTIRINNFPAHGNNTYTIFNVYKGANKTATVNFSWTRGDIIGADYLWSNKRYKTSVMVVSKYFKLMVDGPTSTNVATKFDRRITYLDAGDLDSNWGEKPGYPDDQTIVGKMRQRGYQLLKNQTMVTIARADIAPLSRYIYRRDYNLGDLVMLDGNFGAMAVMRVVEHVEIQDENGTSGHPTLSVPTA